jgi:MFS family permease
MMLNGFADGLFTPTGVAYVAKIVPDEHRSLGMAILTSGLDMGGSLGAFVSGTIIALGGSYEAVFIVTSVVALSGVVIKLRAK